MYARLKINFKVILKMKTFGHVYKIVKFLYMQRYKIKEFYTQAFFFSSIRKHLIYKKKKV